MFAPVRVTRIETRNELEDADAHGRRDDLSSVLRVDPLRATNILYASSYVSDPRDVVGAWDATVAQAGAKTYGKKPIALHIMAIVSPKWIAETGGIHDRNNPRNPALFEHAQAWAVDTFGDGSVIAARMDLDESGGGVVDIFVVPIKTTSINGGRPGNYILTNAALEEVKNRFGGLCTYAALQNSWAKYCQLHLDKRLRRGQSVNETGRQHVHADVYRQTAIIAVAEAKADARAAFQSEFAAEVERLRVEQRELEVSRTAMQFEEDRIRRESQKVKSLLVAQSAKIHEREKRTGAFENLTAQIANRTLELVPVGSSIKLRIPPHTKLSSEAVKSLERDLRLANEIHFNLTLNVLAAATGVTGRAAKLPFQMK